MSDVLAVVAGLLAMIAAAVGVMVFGTFFVVRSALRRTRQSRSTVTSIVQLRSAAIPLGTRGEIGRLRWALRTNLTQTERVLASQVIAGTGPNPFADLLVPLQQTARQLDAHLALIEREPDPLLRRDLLHRLSARADQVIADAAALRGAAYGLADHVHSTVAEPLIDDVRDRITGLLAAMRDLRTVR
jgi:hypothetical protein